MKRHRETLTIEKIFLMNEHLFLLVLLTFSVVDGHPPIETKLGSIRGKQVSFQGIPVDAYLGVPYAKPPLGDLRFRKPAPVEAWKGVIPAEELPPACCQFFTGLHPWYDNSAEESEDCLYLNIWVPMNTSRNNTKAVLFWVHGGRFDYGSTRIPLYNGEALATVGDIIVVTVNYRLSALGFLYFKSEEAPGNQGIYDILEGLKWVNRHIAAFGGDKNRITIAGESAGAVTVGLFTTSPLAKGLYRNIILQSGSPTYLLAENARTMNLNRSEELAKAVNCSDDEVTTASNPQKIIRCLKEVDAEKLLEAEFTKLRTNKGSFIPMYGDDLFPKNALEAIINGEFHGSDVLIGNNQDEGARQLTKSEHNLFGYKDTEISKSTGEKLLRILFPTFLDLDLLFQHYLGNLKEDDYEEVRHQVYTALGDYISLCPSKYFAEAFSKSNNVYYYFFTHRSNTSSWTSWEGDVLFTEVEFVFGQPVLEPQNYTFDEYILSINIMRKWANFVKVGMPSNEGSWPTYSKDEENYMNLDIHGNNIGTELHSENCNFFRPYFGFHIN